MAWPPGKGVTTMPGEANLSLCGSVVCCGSAGASKSVSLTVAVHTPVLPLLCAMMAQTTRSPRYPVTVGCI